MVDAGWQQGEMCAVKRNHWCFISSQSRCATEFCIKAEKKVVFNMIKIQGNRKFQITDSCFRFMTDHTTNVWSTSRFSQCVFINCWLFFSLSCFFPILWVHSKAEVVTSHSVMWPQIIISSLMLCLFFRHWTVKVTWAQRLWWSWNSFFFLTWLELRCSTAIHWSKPKSKSDMWWKCWKVSGVIYGLDFSEMKAPCRLEGLLSVQTSSACDRELQQQQCMKHERKFFIINEERKPKI